MKNKTISKKCGLFEIFPNRDTDTYNGKPITSGVMFMHIHSGSCDFTHNGKPVKLLISSGLDGSSFLMVEGCGRTAKVDMRAFINAAIEQGLLDAKMDFK